MPSKVPAILDYLVTLFTSDATIGQANPPVTVYDGPPTTALDAPLKLFVGLIDPDSDTTESAATLTQVREGLSTATRLEDVAVHCAAEAWAGTDDMHTVRVAAFGILAAVETLIRGDLTATPMGFANPGLAAGELLQNNTQTGAIARVTFDLTFRCFT